MNLHSHETKKDCWYHIPAETLEKQHIPATVIADLSHCAIAVSEAEGKAGTTKAGSTGQYWLFELGAAQLMAEPVQLDGSRKFRLLITDYRTLSAAKDRINLPNRYEYLYAV